MDLIPLSELTARAAADMAARLGSVYVQLRRSAHQVFPRWLALATDGLQRFAAYAEGAQLVLTAVGDQLDRIASLWGERRLSGESDVALRARIVELESARPPTGTVADYEAWVRDVEPTATGVWIEPAGMGSGTVRVWYWLPGDGATGSPGGASIAAVQAYLDDLRAVCAFPMVFAPPTLTVTLTITLSSDVPRVRAAVTGELERLLALRRGPNSTIYNSELRAAIGRGADAHYTLDSVMGDGTGLSDVVQGDEVAVLGAITWL